jgi:uncharacterized protein
MGSLPETWTLPGVNDVNRHWFESGALRVQTCTECAVLQHPPEEICHRCGSLSFTTTELAPTGTIHTYTVVHYAVNRALADSVPYAVVLVALDGDPSVRVVGNLYDVPLDEIHIGMAVHAFWQERSDEFGTVLLPQWSPT